jgi:hypothetical protein
MAFVHVPHIGLDPQNLEGAHTADAQQDLLRDAYLGVAVVEPFGELAVNGAVDFEIGIEHVKAHASDLKLPDAAVTSRPGREIWMVTGC